MIRRRWALSRIAVVALIVVAVAAPHGAPARAAPAGKCDAGWFDGACEAAKGAADGVRNIVSAPVEMAAGGAMDSLTRWVAEAAVSLISKVTDLMETTTDPRLGTGWFIERYELMMGFGLLVVLPLLLLAAIRAIARQDLGQLLRSFFVYLPIAILVTFVAINLVQALLAVTDEMSRAVSEGVGDDATRFLQGGSKSVSGVLGAPGASGFLVFFGALVIVLAGFLLWLELLIRSAGIYVCVFFLPLVLAGLVWPSTARWTRRLVETLVALILSKFVIVAIISLAVAAMGEPGEGGVSTVIGGSALLSLASFAPFALFKLIPIGEVSAIGHLEGMERRPGQAMRSGGFNLQHFVKDKVAQGNAGGSATRSGMAGAGAAGGATAASLGVIASAGAAKKAADVPGQRLNRQGDALGAGRRRADAGGELRTPNQRPNKTEE